MAAANQLDLTIAGEMERKQLTPAHLLQVALSNSAGIDVIERLAALQEKAMAREAEVEFNLAMNAAQAEIGRIAPKSDNKQTGTKYANYAQLDAVIRPVYLKHGFSLSFDSGDTASPETVVAYCYVSHRSGHTRKYQSPPMPKPVVGPQGKAVMTDTHGTGAAMSYAMRYLLKYIFNIAIGEDDTDGNAPQMSVEQSDRLQEWIDSINGSASYEELESHFREAYKANPNQSARDAIIYAKNKRKNELRGAK